MDETFDDDERERKEQEDSDFWVRIPREIRQKYLSLEGRASIENCADWRNLLERLISVPRLSYHRFLDLPQV